MLNSAYLHTHVLSGASVYMQETVNAIAIKPVYFENTIVYSGGIMEVVDNICLTPGVAGYSAGERVFNTLTVQRGGEFDMCNQGIVSNGDIQGVLNMEGGAVLQKTLIHSGGIAYLTTRAKGEDITVSSGGNLYIAITAKAENVAVNGGAVHVATGGMLSDVTVSGDGKLYLYGGAILDGEINVKGTMYLDDDTVNNGNVNFVLSENSSDPMLNDYSRLTGGSCSVTVADSKAGEYLIAGNADSFCGSVEVRDSSGAVTGELSTQGFLTVDDVVYTLSNDDGMLSIDAMIQAYKKSISWETNGAAGQYILEYSTDNFANVFRVNVNSSAMDNYLPAAGTYQWRVSFDGNTWINGEQIIFETQPEAENIFSDADGDMDIFFANAAGSWESSYAAQHLGAMEGWSGTGEKVILAGKNKLADLFAGSTDANILVLTDDSNGDALFVDDVYTALGDQARLAQIDEIRAGAGDDVVDMTSQRYAYAGDGVKVYGGLGNDTVWANKGNNTLCIVCHIPNNYKIVT